MQKTIFCNIMYSIKKQVEIDERLGNDISRIFNTKPIVPDLANNKLIYRLIGMLETCMHDEPEENVSLIGYFVYDVYYCRQRYIEYNDLRIKEASELWDILNSEKQSNK